MRIPFKLSGQAAAWSVAVCCLLSPWAALAQAGPAPETVLASGPAGDLTAADVLLMVDDLVPPEQRPGFWANPDAVARFARSLYAQRALAAQAQAEGLHQQPAGQRYLRLLNDRALTDLLLEQRSQQALPDEPAILAYARSDYNAKPERFVTREQVQVRHILLAVADDGGNADAVHKRALAMAQELRSGGDFAALARAHSSDKNSARRGGELDFFERGRMEIPFEEAAFALENPGDLSEPVKTRFGWHIIELLGRKPATQLSFDEVLPQLRTELTRKIDADARNKVFNEASAQASIDVQAVQALSDQQAAATGQSDTP